MDGFYIGDIIGTAFAHEYELLNMQTKEFELFNERSNYSDDTILTFATMDWLMHSDHTSKEMIKYLKKYYDKYPDKEVTMYGKDYVNWITSNPSSFKKSTGNGGAMRASVIGWYASSLDEIKDLVSKAIAPTHDTNEAILAAEVVAIAVFMMRNNRTKDELKNYLDLTYDYYLDQKLALLRNYYEFTIDAKETVRPAIIAFLESNSFEDALRNAVSLGGDCDTITNITCSIAGAFYEIPNDIKDKALNYLPDEFKDLLEEFKALNKGESSL